MPSAIGMSDGVVILRFVSERPRWRPARRQVVHHHARVVGRVEVGVGGGQFVGFDDGAETERLRGLREKVFGRSGTDLTTLRSPRSSVSRIVSVEA